MAISSVAHDVNKNILFEFESVLHSDPYASINDCGFICINMKDWGADNLSDFSTVIGGSTLRRVRREADLVIHDNVDDTFWRIIF